MRNSIVESTLSFQGTANFLDLDQENFLGPRGPLVLPLVNPYVRTPAMKIWIQCIQANMLMNHQETPQTNPMAQWDPLDVSFNPLGPPGPPHRPLEPLKRSLGLIEI